MSCRSNEEESNAPPDPSFSTPTKVIRNAGAAHAESDAERMVTEPDADASVEKQFDKSTGKKRKFAPFHEYSVVGQWATCPNSLLETAEIEHQIKMFMKKFMQDSRLMIAPGKDPEKNKTDKALWKQQRKPYWNSRTDEVVHMFKCLMDHRCRCTAKVRICTGKIYKRLEFHGTHDETMPRTIPKTLSYKQIATIHDAVMVTPKQSDTVLRRNLMHAQQSGSTQAHASVSAALYPATCPDIPEDFDPAETRRCNSARIHW